MNSCNNLGQGKTKYTIGRVPPKSQEIELYRRYRCKCKDHGDSCCDVVPIAYGIQTTWHEKPVLSIVAGRSDGGLSFCSARIISFKLDETSKRLPTGKIKRMKENLKLSHDYHEVSKDRFYKIVERSRHALHKR